MTARLNHTIVAARDKDASALFLTEMLGLPAPMELGPFAVVAVGDRLTLDYVDSEDDIVPQHYAFLVEEAEFDEIFERIAKRGMPYWADPFRHERGAINHWDDGRCVLRRSERASARDHHETLRQRRDGGSAPASADRVQDRTNRSRANVKHKGDHQRPHADGGSEPS